MFKIISIKISMTYTRELGKQTLKLFGKRKTANSPDNTEHKEQARRCHNTQLQTILPSNKNSMVLTQKHV
jgi:hypothetical protein